MFIQLWSGVGGRRFLKVREQGGRGLYEVEDGGGSRDVKNDEEGG